jgi:hypothetical protein
VYAFDGVAGQEIEIRVNAPNHRPYVQIDGPGRFTSSNDRDPYSAEVYSNSRLTVRLPADGVYRIQVSSTQPNEMGAYALSIVDGAIAERERAAVLASVPDMFLRAAQALSAGDNATAISLYQRGLNLVADADAFNDLGVAQFRNGDYFAARLSFDTALARNPNHPHARGNLLAAEQAYNARQAQRQQAFDQNEARQRQENARLWSSLGTIAGAYVRNEVLRNAEPQAQAGARAGGAASAPHGGGASSLPTTQRPQRQTPPTRVHNPANDATYCMQRRALAGTDVQMVNGCNFPVELAWCFVGGDPTSLSSCERVNRSTGYQWNYSPGNGPSIPPGYEVRYGACRGRESMVSVEGPAGRPNYVCPDIYQ